MSTTFVVKPVQFGETVTDAAGHITISPDFHVYLGMEADDEDAGKVRTATMTMPPEKAKQLARMLNDAAARARHMQFTAEKARRKAEKEGRTP